MTIYTVYAEYSGQMSSTKDSAIRKAAGRQDDGSGYLMIGKGTRDISFTFKRAASVTDAVNRIKKIKGVKVSVMVDVEAKAERKGK